jgi:hypothetical protein
MRDERIAALDGDRLNFADGSGCAHPPRLVRTNPGDQPFAQDRFSITETISRAARAAPSVSTGR